MSSKYYFILLVLFLASCKVQEEPVDITEKPTFAAKATVNGQTFNLTAGENNYYMFSSFAVDVQNVTIFNGELKQEGCINCGPSLALSIRGNGRGPTDVNTALAAGDYQFRDSSSNSSDRSFKVAFTSQPQGSGAVSHSWDFGNGQTATSANPVMTYKQEGSYNVTYTASFSNGCSSTHTQPLFVSTVQTGNNPEFNYNYTDTLKILFNSIPVDSAGDVYWTFGDGQSGTGPIIMHTYSLPGQYRVCMKMQRPGMDSVSTCKLVSTRDYSGCSANFSYNRQTINDSLHLSDISITWTDPDGVQYSSNHVEQLPGSSFRVIESSDYVRNEKGQKTRKLKVIFSCRASSGSNIIELTNVEATIAVAYP